MAKRKKGLRSISDVGLEDLFDGMGAFQEDLMEFGAIGASAAGGVLAYKWLEGQVAPSLPAMLTDTDGVMPAIEIVVGVVGGTALMRMSAIPRQIGMGVAVGLVADGIVTAAKQFGLIGGMAGLGQDDQSLLYGAPVSVEEQSMLQGAPVDVTEEGGSMQGYSGLAATFQ